MTAATASGAPQRVAPRDGAWATRLSGLAVAGAAGTVLGVAAWLKSDGRGHGTHEQLMLPRCGWVAMFDKPCPTCGMTTSFSHAADGELAQAAVVQPMGTLLSLLAAVMVWGGLHSLLTGARIGGFATKLLNRWTVTALLLALLAAWGYKLLTWG